eukprot:GHVR01158652.1.p1 GENE.GHVR01158652.1~~GHVR01158652.1.p1  ORF type:complete len:107 (-),score=0.98 GHVR01158652.1:105-425(-)
MISLNPCRRLNDFDHFLQSNNQKITPKRSHSPHIFTNSQKVIFNPQQGLSPRHKENRHQNIHSPIQLKVTQKPLIRNSDKKSQRNKGSIANSKNVPTCDNHSSKDA